MLKHFKNGFMAHGGQRWPEGESSLFLLPGIPLRKKRNGHGIVYGPASSSGSSLIPGIQPISGSILMSY